MITVIKNASFITIRLLLLVCIAFSTSCSEEELTRNSTESSIDNDLLNGRAEIRAVLCKNLFCTEVEVLSNLEIELASDTLEASNNIAWTDDEGKVAFNSLQNSTYVLKASYDQQQFIERFSVTKDGVSYHELIFSPYCSLEGNRLKNCDRNIRFDNLSVGQQNKYLLYRSSETSGSLDKSFQYMDDTLTLEVVEKVEDSKWLVRERFIRPEEMPFQIYSVYDISSLESNIVYTLEFKNDSLFVEVPNAYSYLFYDLWFDGYALDLENYEYPRCSPVGWWSDCGTSQYYISVENPQFLDYTFDGVFRNEGLYLSGGDGPDTGLLYNNNQGLIHTFQYSAYQDTPAYGFTKIE